MRHTLKQHTGKYIVWCGKVTPRLSNLHNILTGDNQIYAPLEIDFNIVMDIERLPDLHYIQ